jgi:hypothetical protein
MAFDTNLAVRIATVLDNTGLKNADKGMKSLEKRARSLGKTLGLTLSTAAVVAYGRASVKAFMQDEAAATRLASAVKNLGLAFEQPAIDSYVQKLEASSAVADDSLRPALQSLLTTTRSLSESQKILGLALDVSRGTGRELTQVTQDLAQAYVGNTRGLRKYNLGLTQAELKTISFAEVQERLSKQFTGANAAFLDTYAGKLQVLTVASGNAQEVIGKGLVDALVLAGGKDADIQDVADAMADLSLYTADAIRGVGVLASKFNGLSGGFLGDLLKAGFATSGLGLLSRLGADSRPRPRANRNVTGRNNTTLFDADAAKQKKIDAERAKLTAAQVKAQKALTAEQKKQAMAKKQSALFDLDQIQLVAALQGNLSKEEELRVKLQLALLTNNTTEADKLSQRLANSIDSTGQLAAYLRALPDAKNPFLGWDAWLKTFTQNLATVTGSTIPTTGGGVSPAPITPVIPATNLPSNPITNMLGGGNASTRTAQEAARLYGGMGSSQQIVVQIDGKAIASALQDQNLSGVNSNVDRLLGQFR